MAYTFLPYPNVITGSGGGSTCTEEAKANQSPPVMLLSDLANPKTTPVSNMGSIAKWGPPLLLSRPTMQLHHGEIKAPFNRADSTRSNRSYWASGIVGLNMHEVHGMGVGVGAHSHGDNKYRFILVVGAQVMEHCPTGRKRKALGYRRWLVKLSISLQLRVFKEMHGGVFLDAKAFTSGLKWYNLDTLTCSQWEPSLLKNLNSVK